MPDNNLLDNNNSNNPLLVATDIQKEYPWKDQVVQALHSTTLAINKGEFVALTGPSGSGKSTLLTILGSLNPPSAGKLLIANIDVYQLSQEQRADLRASHIGFVFQQMHLLPYLNAVENVMLPLTVSKWTKTEKKELALQVLDKVGLANKALRLPRELSGGEQQRVAIARALVSNPPLLLADEPTGSLDINTGQEILQLFQKFNQQGHTIVMVTHNPETINYSSRQIKLRDGQLIADCNLEVG